MWLVGAGCEPECHDPYSQHGAQELNRIIGCETIISAVVEVLI